MTYREKFPRIRPEEVPRDTCDECPEGRDLYDADELAHFDEDRLCPVHTANRLTREPGKWKQTDHPGDFYDRITKCEDDK